MNEDTPQPGLEHHPLAGAPPRERRASVGRGRWCLALVVSGLLGLALPGGAFAGDVFDAPQDPLSPRLPLLDESGLDKFSRPAPETPSEAIVDKEYPPNQVIPLDTENLRYFSYFTKIRRRIDQSYSYPREAAQELLNGIVTVSFEIQRNGNLGEAKVTGSSGKEILDEAALTIVHSAAPFSAIPPRIHHDPLRVMTHIRFIPSQEAVQRHKGLDLLNIPLD